MARNLFGTDGIRGKANVYPLDNIGCNQIGKAIGRYFADEGEVIIVGYDPRESSPEIAKWVIEGINCVGVDTHLVDVVPTPGLAFLTKNGDYACGVMITASHNPFSDNGIKVFDKNGGKLPDETEENLNSLIDSVIQNSSEPGKNYSAINKLVIYENFLSSSVGESEIKGLRIVLDCANGATSELAVKVFEKLGAQVTAIFNSPDGININENCGATNTKALSEKVVELQADCGAAFDGDGDRLIMVDSLGREMDGDYIMYIIALTNNLSGVVATVMSNQGFENSLKSKNINLVRTAVGDRYVLEGLEDTGYKLGGEQSGHIVLPNLTTTGDGMLAALQTIASTRKSDKSLAEWRDSMTHLPQAMTNLILMDKDLLNTPKIKEFIEEKTKEIASKGRLLIRPSGTEPKVRIMVEAENAEEIANEVANSLKSLLAEVAK